VSIAGRTSRKDQLGADEPRYRFWTGTVQAHVDTSLDIGGRLERAPARRLRAQQQLASSVFYPTQPPAKRARPARNVIARSRLESSGSNINPILRASLLCRPSNHQTFVGKRRESVPVHPQLRRKAIQFHKDIAAVRGGAHVGACRQTIFMDGACCSCVERNARRAGQSGARR
jgi:hypothetical protein